MDYLRSLLICALLGTGAAHAGEADVERAQISRQADGTYRFIVTVAHRDTGWDHYAERWQILAPGGQVLGERRLLHPHVNEQPFTRSLGGVEIPPGIETVIVRALDSVHGDGGKIYQLSVPR